jgi:hypothetical protein
MLDNLLEFIGGNPPRKEEALKWTRRSSFNGFP